MRNRKRGGSHGPVRSPWSATEPRSYRRYAISDERALRESAAKLQVLHMRLGREQMPALRPATVLRPAKTPMP